MDNRDLPLLRMARRIKQKPAMRGWLSTGELLAVALILNKPRWLAEAGFTLTSAIDRLGPDWLDLALRAAHDLHNPDVF